MVKSMMRAVLVLLSFSAMTLMSAHATTLTPMTAQERFIKSDLVCEVVVQKSNARWLYVSGQNRIVTFYNAKPLTLFRGALAKSEDQSGKVIIALPGGVVDGIGQRVHSVPTLKEGERWLIHLGPPTGPGNARGVIGFEKGATKLPATPSLQDELRNDFAETIRGWAP